MRLAIFSDVHGDIEALESAWIDIQSQSVEAIFCLGDLVGYRGAANEVVEFIRRRQIPTVMGDFDEVVGFDLSTKDHYHLDPQKELLGQQSLHRNKQSTSAENKAFLRSLSLQIRDELEGVRVLMVHGSPRQIDEYVYDHHPKATFEELAKYAGSDVVFLGHTGQAFTKKVGGTWFVNPGSIGNIPGDQGPACYCLANLDGVPEMLIRRVARNISSSISASHQTDEILETSKVVPAQDLEQITTVAADLKSSESAQQERKAG